MICIIICKCYRHFYNICATHNTFSEPMSSNPLDDVRHVYECMQFSNHYSLFFSAGSSTWKMNVYDRGDAMGKSALCYDSKDIETRRHDYLCGSLQNVELICILNMFKMTNMAEMVLF